MKEVVVKFDHYLKSKGLKFEAIIIGGAALNILDISDRKTKDVDCLDPHIPIEIKKASSDFAIKYKEFGLDVDWLNNGPETLKTDLPKGWRLRLQVLYAGDAIHFECLGRADLIKSKLFAYCDRISPDFEDLKKIKPTKTELDDAIDWVVDRDEHTNWKKHVELSFNVLRKALGYV